MKRLLIFSFVLFSLSSFSQQTTKKWTLQECVAYAIQNNISVKQGELSTQLQEAEVKRAKMDFYPSVNGNVGTSFSFDNPHSNTAFSNTFGISSNAILYNGNRNKNSVVLAENEVEISKLNTAQTQDGITLQIVNAYLNILYNIENVKIAKEQLNIGQKLVRKMEELVEAGVNAKNDSFQVEANLAANEESLVKAENNLDLALLDLSQILQIPNTYFDVATVDLDIESAKLLYNNSDLIYQKALSHRSEIVSAKKSIERSEINIEMAKAGKLPVVSANYSFNTLYNYDFETDFSQTTYFSQLEKNRGHRLGVSLSIPIFDKNVTNINTQKAQIQRDLATYKLENEKINLRATIERAFIDAKTSLKTYEAAKKSVFAQEEAFKAAEERYNAGVLTSYDFDQVRNQLVHAQSAFINAKYNYIFRTKFLDFYAGNPIKL